MGLKLRRAEERVVIQNPTRAARFKRLLGRAVKRVPRKPGIVSLQHFARPQVSPGLQDRADHWNCSRGIRNASGLPTWSRARDPVRIPQQDAFGPAAPSRTSPLSRPPNPQLL